MKGILISDKPKWCFLMMSGDKGIEVRTSKALAKAVQNLIDDYGYADIYVYCSKDTKYGLVWDKYGKGIVNSRLFPYAKGCPENHRLVNGKVIFKFECRKVEEIKKLNDETLLKKSCLTKTELINYLLSSKYSLVMNNGYALHISNLTIFEKPKELGEFYKFFERKDEYMTCMFACRKSCHKCQLTKAPQNFCYVEQ